VDMVWHQTIRPHLHLPVLTPLSQEGQVGLVVLGAEERLLPAVPPLGDMVGNSGYTTRAIRAMFSAYAALRSRSRVAYGVPGIADVGPELTLA